MLFWQRYQHFHTIRNLRDLMGRWFGGDIFFLNEEGEFVDFLNEKYFYNPLVSDFFKTDSLKKSLANFLYLQTSRSKQAKLLEWEKTGLSVLAVPIFKDQVWSGLIGVTGFVTQGDQLEKIRLHIKKGGLKNKINLQILDDKQLFYMQEMASSLAQELVMAYEDEKNVQDKLKNFSNSSYRYSGLIGRSPKMMSLYSFLEKIKVSDSSVLIQGENGTGKELVAQAIYKNSSRAGKSFIIQNCSALNENLLESELFGHVRGAFTGAIQNKKGLFEMADGGTFFLDEIGDISLSMQAKLLRVLQDGTFFPVGSVQSKQVNVRIVAATNRNIKEMIKEGVFREDLFYRLNVINISIPPLRDRKEDIPLLIQYFMIQENKDGYKPMSKEAMDYLIQYPWPGNVRELKNEVHRLCVLSQSKKEVSADHLSKKILIKDGIHAYSTGFESEGLKLAIKNLEKQMIQKSLEREGWNKTRVAKKLGISRAALISKVKNYDLKKQKEPA